MAVSPASFFERHTIGLGEEVVPFAIGKNVVLHVNEESRARDRDSSRASSRQVCEYKWQDRGQYRGRLLTVHGTFVAYRLYNENMGEAVRVLDRQTRNRHLIKDFRSRIADLQFAMHRPLLAVVDTDASLYIYLIEASGTNCVKYLNVIRDHMPMPLTPKISWCPYSEEYDDVNMLALTIDNHVEVMNLVDAKEKGALEVMYDQFSSIKRVTLDSLVTAAHISPDATALVVCTESGLLKFFVIEDSGLTPAHESVPIINQFPEEIVFFDNLLAKQQERYWTFAAISSDNGQRISVFDGDSWEVVAKLRFDYPVVGKLELVIDQSAKFLYVIDYEGKNLFCVEMEYVNDVPLFASVTMIAFFNTIFIIVPIRVEEREESDDLVLDDDDEDSKRLLAHLVAITPRALLEYRVELESSVLTKADPHVASTPLPKEVANGENATAAPSTKQRQEEEPPKKQEPIGSPPPPIAAPSLPTAIGEPPATAETSPAPQKAPAVKQPPPLPIQPPVIVNAVDTERVVALIEQRFSAMDKKINNLFHEVDKVKLEVESTRVQYRNDLSSALETISNDLRARDEKVEQALAVFTSQVYETVGHQLESIQANSHQDLLTRMDGKYERIFEVFRTSVPAAILGSMDNLSQEIITRLVEEIHGRLGEFNDQLRKLHTDIQNASSANSSTIKSPDPSATVAQLLESNDNIGALKFALEQHDHTALMKVCKAVDLDELFDTPEEVSALSPEHLQTFIDLVIIDLGTDTAVKFHGLQVALVALSDYRSITRSLQHVRSDLVPFAGVTDAALKRSLRVINSLLSSFN